MHTYTFKSTYYNPRASEVNVQLDFDEYKLLNPDFLQIDDQDTIRKSLDLHKYRTLPDPWDTNYICVDNFLLAMYSKMQLGKMLKHSNIEFDYVIFLRPDVRYLNDFDIRYFDLIDERKICIPGFHLFPLFNDRFTISNYDNAILIANLFDFLFEYSTEHVLHSETFQHLCIVNHYQLKIVYIPIYFNRVRANGLEEKDYTNYNENTQQYILNKIFPNKPQEVRSYIQSPLMQFSSYPTKTLTLQLPPPPRQQLPPPPRQQLPPPPRQPLRTKSNNIGSFFQRHQTRNNRMKLRL
jgi:hypothetical protein